MISQTPILTRSDHKKNEVLLYYETSTKTLHYVTGEMLAVEAVDIEVDFVCVEVYSEKSTKTLHGECFQWTQWTSKLTSTQKTAMQQVRPPSSGEHIIYVKTTNFDVTSQAIFNGGAQQGQLTDSS